MRISVTFGIGLASVLLASAQQNDIKIEITKIPKRVSLAAGDIPGMGASGPFKSTLNQTLYNDLESAGLFKLVPKTLYPLNSPHQAADFRGVTAPQGQSARDAGYYFSDWSGSPPQADYLAFGYAADQNHVLTLHGAVFNVKQTSVAGAQVLAKSYFADMNEAGARKVAHEFAADIIVQFGGMSLLGTHIYFVSDRTGSKEIWSMDPDGGNQKQLTKFRSITIEPAVSPDGTKIAFASYAKGRPAIFVATADTGRPLPFRNQAASLNLTPAFTPDGKHILYSSTAAGGSAQLYMATLDGSEHRRISYRKAIDIDPKVNPKTGSEVLFVSGPPTQIYRMDISGSNVEMASPGGGEAADPAWHPDGQTMAFAWTRGFATGAFNIFIMDVASRQYNQLTHEGRNEHPNWAPDGLHLVFQSNRHGRMQIWSMLADGTAVKQLTTQGHNERPVWGK